jgi:ATP-binding cassette, subfamily B, bacterial
MVTADRHTLETAHFTLGCPAGSFAAERLASLGTRAEHAWQALHGFAGDAPVPATKIAIYFDQVQPDPAMPGAQLARGSYADPERGGILSVFQPESQAEGLEESIARLLVFQPLAPEAGQIPFLRAGVAAYALHQNRRLIQARRRPSQDQVDAGVKAAMAAGAPIDIMPWLVERSPVDPHEHGDFGMSFLAYLSSQYGQAALREFLAHYDTQNPDSAATAAFQKPVATLVNEWLGGIAQSLSEGVSVRAFLGRLTPYLKPYPRQCAEIVFYLLFAIGFSTVLQLSFKFLIDRVLPSKDVALLGQAVVVLVVLFLVNALLTYRRAYITAWVSEQLLIHLRLQVFEHLNELSAGFYGRSRVGDIVSRMSNDLTTVQGAVSNALLTGMFYILSFVVALVTLLVLDWRLTIVVLVTLPLLFIASVALSGPVQKASRVTSERLGESTNVLQEVLNAQTVVRAFGLQGLVNGQYREVAQRLFSASVKMATLGSLYGLASDLVSNMIQLLVIALGFFLILEGHMELGTLMAFTGMVSSLTGPVQSMSQIIQSLQQAGGSMQRITELMDEPIEVEDAPDAKPLARLQTTISFEHVDFSYTPDRPTLQDVTVEIPAGIHMSIVGPSGSGKSSMLNMITRFYDPQSGGVSFDGVDIHAVKQDSLREQLAFVPQDTFLFNTTIHENIKYGRLDATDAEIVEAAKAAEIDDYIQQMPNGYNTMVGERGSLLSGGQRQRVAIARAMLRRPTVLLLDEATSALDPQTESQINDTLTKLSGNLTMISVTHRLASAARSDRVLVLDRGVLVEDGSHAELMSKGGLYARLYEEQYGRSQPGGEQKITAKRLAQVPIFAGLADDSLAAVAARMNLERYAAGDLIARQGEAGDKLYLIDQGEVELSVNDALGDHAVGTLHEGEYFGDIALLLEIPRPGSVRAASATELLTLGRADLNDLAAQLPDLAQRLSTEARDAAQQRLNTAGAQASAPAAAT